MAFTFVQSNSAVSASTSSLGVSLTGVTAGSLIAVWAKHEAGSATLSMSDGTSSLTGGTYRSHSNNDLHGQWFYLLAANSGNRTYTLTLSGARSFVSLIVFEYTYTGTATFDAQNTNFGTSTAPNSGNFTTTGTDEVCFGGYGEYSTFALSSPLINGLAADGSVILSGPTTWTAAWRRVFGSTFTGAASATLAGTAEWICNGISFKAAAGGTTINANTASATLATNAALVSLDRIINASRQALNLATLAAAITRRFNATFQALSLTANAAVVAIGTNILAGFQQLQLQTFQATVTGTPPPTSGSRRWQVLGIPIAVRF